MEEFYLVLVFSSHKVQAAYPQFQKKLKGNLRDVNKWKYTAHRGSKWQTVFIALKITLVFVYDGS